MPTILIIWLLPAFPWGMVAGIAYAEWYIRQLEGK